MITIACQTEFTECKRLLRIYTNEGGTACVCVRRTNTYEVVKEVTDVGTEDAMELHVKRLSLYAKREIVCCTR